MIFILFFQEYFRGICELLETMKLDMANFSIRQYRPLIQQYAFEYERKQFQKLIEHNPSTLLFLLIVYNKIMYNVQGSQNQQLNYLRTRGNDV